MMTAIKTVTPAKGYVQNPFYQGSIRNKSCACYSGRKVKKCHGVNPYIKKEDLDKMLEDMSIMEAQIKGIEL